MNSVWKLRQKLLREHLESLVERLSEAKPAELAEHTVRLLAAATLLIRQHHINKRGQCLFCGWTRWSWRVWRRRPQCTVYRAFLFTVSHDLDEVWWQLLNSVGKKASLAEVREWLAYQQHDTHQLADDRDSADSDDHGGTGWYDDEPTVVLRKIREQDIRPARPDIR